MRKFLLAASLAVATACAPLTVPVQTGRLVTAIAQTGALTPGFYTIEGDSHKKELDNLTKWIRTETKFTVAFEIPEGVCFGCVGATSPSLKMVVIDGEQPINMQYATLLHEAAHVLFLPTKDKQVQEVVAETTAYLAAKQVGLDTARQSFSYLNDHADAGFRDMVLARFSKEIDELVKVLVKASKG